MFYGGVALIKSSQSGASQLGCVLEISYLIIFGLSKSAFTIYIKNTISTLVLKPDFNCIYILYAPTTVGLFNRWWLWKTRPVNGKC